MGDDMVRFDHSDAVFDELSNTKESEKENRELKTLSDVLGWLYFLCWTISFIPQIYKNYKRRSVDGLSMDFVYLNFLGFSFLFIYTYFMYFSESIRKEYRKHHNGKDNLVSVNDLLFSFFALIFTAVTLIQSIYYPGGINVKKAFCKPCIKNEPPSSATTTASTNGHNISGNHSASIINNSSMPLNRTNEETHLLQSDDPEEKKTATISQFTVWFYLYAIVSTTVYVIYESFKDEEDQYFLGVLYYMSSMKMVVTLTKYTPQIYLNYRRKSIEAWSMENTVLDFSGGTLSLGQLFVDAERNKSWDGVTGDPIKFCLGLVSMIFDTIFFIQYKMYSTKAKNSNIQDIGESERDNHHHYEENIRINDSDDDDDGNRNNNSSSNSNLQKQ